MMTIKASVVSALLLSFALFAGANATLVVEETSSKPSLELYHTALAAWQERDQFEFVEADIRDFGDFDTMVKVNPTACKQVGDYAACFVRVEGDLSLATGYQGETLLFGLSAYADAL